VTDPRPLRVGDLIRNNSPRARAKTARVSALLGAVILVFDDLGRGRALFRQFIYLDGRPRRSGWSLVT